ncbi:MAG: 2-dehydro-3-deoxyphosphogluconate aldolase [Proteobacteria bacterium]|nr:2-dehydro-3-deoxyphosphogluconate aldolase [Pseudomonadota bacterium]MBU1715051.1 2-dehydro-3-deoxyphosphogluconate aldolase [Pseudomonadota bacterium]
MDLETPVIGILRGVEASLFKDIMDASFASGLQAIEVTMNTVGAPEIISGCRTQVPPGKLLGMGTIRNLAEAKIAVEAGAMFMVSPNLDLAVIEYARQQGVPIVVGALTPTEVYAAHAAGAAMVKVFPCGVLGPVYIRELLGPFDQIPLVAVGGVNFDNLDQYFKAGAVAVGVSSSLFGKEALRQKNMVELAANVKKFIGHCHEARA